MNFSSPIGITGAAFCDGCGLAGREGDLLFGDCCAGGAVRRRVSLEARATTWWAAHHDARRSRRPDHSMEVAPNGRIYFSTTTPSGGWRRPTDQRACKGSQEAGIRNTEVGVASRKAMDIGQPKRIIEIEPVTLPVPGEEVPEPEPARQPDQEPAPAVPISDGRELGIDARRARDRRRVRADRRLARLGAHGTSRRRRLVAPSGRQTHPNVEAPRDRRGLVPDDAWHDAPDPRCTCGLHGTHGLEVLRKTRCPAVLGRVALWGRVIEHEHGYRARYAYPQRLRLICQFCFWMSGARRSAPEHVGWFPRDELMPLCDEHLSVAKRNGVFPRILLPAEDVDQRLRDTYAVDALAV